MKICTGCKLNKALSEFYRWLDKTNNTLRPQSQCKVCQKRKSKEKYRANPNPKKWNREQHLKSRYGISVANYDEMLANQEGVCWICKRPPRKRRLSVDHCHKTGKVRGLLCWNCNYRLLPIGNDDPVIFQKAADYLNQK